MHKDKDIHISKGWSPNPLPEDNSDYSLLIALLIVLITLTVIMWIL